MKRISIIFSVSLFFLLLSCANQNNNTLDNISLPFKDYLKSVHNLDIPDSLHQYIILNEEGCKYCFKSVFIASNNLVQSKNNVTLIVSFLGKNLPTILNDVSYSEKILFEFKSEYSKTSLGYLGNAVFVTKNNKMIKYIPYEDEKALISHFKKF